jgi:hypothetical protein
MNMQTIQKRTLTLLLGVFLGAAGCGSDDNPAPPDSGIIVTPDGSSPDVASSPPDGGAPDTATSDAAPSDGAAGDVALADGPAGETGASPDGGGNSFPGCLTGKPADRNSLQFLNACSGGCSSFPNATRLTRWNGGNLPVLP